MVVVFQCLTLMFGLLLYALFLLLLLKFYAKILAACMLALDRCYCTVMDVGMENMHTQKDIVRVFSMRKMALYNVLHAKYMDSYTQSFQYDFIHAVLYKTLSVVQNPYTNSATQPQEFCAAIVIGHNTV